MFGGDPFGNPFQHMQRQMQEMDNMMNSMMGNSFGMLDSMLGGSGRHNPQQMLGNGGSNPYRHSNNNMMMSPFGGMGGGLFGGIMQQMGGLQQHALNDPNSTVFSQSTMISYDGNGQPRVVQSSTRKAGDVKETRHSEQRGKEARMAVGHSIGDRSHIIEKKRDRDGRIRQQQKFVNLDEAEAEEFNSEFKTRATRNLLGGGGLRAHQHQQQAIQNGSSATSSAKGGNRRIEIGRGESSAPIVTVPDDDEEEDEYRGSKNRRAGRNAHRHNNHADDDDEVEYVCSNTSGPMIREISDEEADMSNPKRRKGLLGKFLRSDN